MKRVLIERNRYFDSVFLMRISHELEQLPDVAKAIVAMGTRANLDSLHGVGFTAEAPSGDVLPRDLVIALDASSAEAIDRARQKLAGLLAGRSAQAAGALGPPRPTTVAEALEIDPNLNLALISVPGAYAAREARRALRHGLHVMLFSDNVSIEDEISLKDEAVGRGLLMMGPDCGTAILNGTPLGFANAVRRGSIGLVGASGTGIQEVSCLVHRLGGGISQAIGTGGRDLSRTVGGRMTRFAIETLADDPKTDVLLLVSKAPEPAVAARAVNALRSAGKPAIVQFVGGGPRAVEDGVRFAATLAEAAEIAGAAAGIETDTPDTPVSPKAAPPHGLGPIAGRVRGLFCGGTLAQEAWDIVRRAGVQVRSNVAVDPKLRIEPGAAETGHVIWDLGDDAFTVGKPHPMIEPSLRDDEVVRCAEDPAIGIVLADCVLGHGAHSDPAGSLADAAQRAADAARKRKRDLVVIASVTGTDEDPQDRSRQVETLEDAGVLVAPSNAAAARWVVEALRGGAA